MTVCVLGNVTAVSDAGGDMRPDTAAGLYVDDRRALSELSLTVGGETPSRVAHGALGGAAEFLASARNLGSLTPDPVVEVRRSRGLVTGGMVESVVITSRSTEPIETVVAIRYAVDAAPISAVKSGRADLVPLEPALDASGARFTAPWHDYVSWLEPVPSSVEVDEGCVVATFSVRLEPQQELTLRLHLVAHRRLASQLDADPGGHLVAWDDVCVSGADPRLGPTVGSAIQDLRALLLTDPLAPQDVFAGAGTPWYLTLFGRDSIWAARMTLPIGTELARGTLRTLARRQGVRYDDASAEAPGKIPHEVRRVPYLDPESGLALPAVYFGTVDATALWVLLLHDAWQWGLPEADVAGLLDPLDAAVDWLVTDAMPDEDGLLKYLDETGTGLANQGWKDSGDAIRFRDGSIAVAPIALVEAQAYAVQALECAARLLDAFGRDGSSQLRERRAALAERIRRRYWVRDGATPYLGLAVDGGGRLVDGIGSNMGHVLGTGALAPAEVASVASHLVGPELLDEFGVRTLGSGNDGFNPLGYHTGSIWTHDTAITALGLAAEGLPGQAVRVARTLLASAEAFDYRWPELYSGEASMGRPAPYPASCRPQAWSAASAVALLTVALGARPDAPARTLHLHPVRPSAYGPMRVEGLRFCGGRIDLDVAADGAVTLLAAPADVTVTIH